MEGKTPWIQVAVGSDHLVHVALLNTSSAYRAIENRLLSNLRKVEGLPRKAVITLSESRDRTPNGMRRGVLVTSNVPQGLNKILGALDLLVVLNARAVEAKQPKILEWNDRSAYYRVSG
jgi:hypothetical protein